MRDTAGVAELISDVLWWTPMHGYASVGRPASTYIHQLCADTGCSLDDLLRVMDDNGGWRERERERERESQGISCYQHDDGYDNLLECIAKIDE